MGRREEIGRLVGMGLYRPDTEALWDRYLDARERRKAIGPADETEDLGAVSPVKVTKNADREAVKWDYWVACVELAMGLGDEIRMIPQLYCDFDISFRRLSDTPLARDPRFEETARLAAALR